MSNLIQVMTDAEREIVNALRLKGFAVVVFSPADLVGVEPTTLQNRLVELGNEAIEDLREIEEDDDTYEVVKFFKDESKVAEVLESGLPLDEAKAFCIGPETSGNGWFLGFRKE